MSSPQLRVFAFREWLMTFLATGLIIYEAVIEHSQHAQVYGVGLVLFGGANGLALWRMVRALGQAMQESGDDAG